MNININQPTLKPISHVLLQLNNTDMVEEQYKFVESSLQNIGLTILNNSKPININTNLKQGKQDEEKISSQIITSSPIVKTFIDARGLPCPKPLLKAKVALRSLEKAEYLYLIASDPNAQHDIQAFCSQTQVTFWLWEEQTEGKYPKIWHFLLGK